MLAGFPSESFYTNYDKQADVSTESIVAVCLIISKNYQIIIFYQSVVRYVAINLAVTYGSVTPPENLDQQANFCIPLTPQIQSLHNHGYFVWNFFFFLSKIFNKHSQAKRPHPSTATEIDLIFLISQDNLFIFQQLENTTITHMHEGTKPKQLVSIYLLQSALWGGQQNFMVNVFCLFLDLDPNLQPNLQT